MSVETNGRRITKDDLQAAFQKVVGDGQETVERNAPKGLLIVGAGALAAIAMAYLAGSRRGKRRSSVVEIRRL